MVDIPHLGTHEQSGMRPAVVVAKVVKNLVTVIPCTSNTLALRFPFTSKIDPTDKNGLTTPTVALIFHIRALDSSFLKKKIGVLSRNDFSKIRKQARDLIG